MPKKVAKKVFAAKKAAVKKLTAKQKSVIRKKKLAKTHVANVSAAEKKKIMSLTGELRTLLKGRATFATPWMTKLKISTRK